MTKSFGLMMRSRLIVAEFVSIAFLTADVISTGLSSDWKAREKTDATALSTPLSNFSNAPTRHLLSTQHQS